MRRIIISYHFFLYWISQTVAQFGVQVALLGIPIVAALYLNATPLQMGIIGFLEFSPFIFFGLVSGAWIDRFARRPILVITSLSKAIMYLAIPIMTITDTLTIEGLYVLTFLIGVCTVFYDIAFESYTPIIITREQLVDGNSRLEASKSAAYILGSGLSGGITQFTVSSFALLFSAGSFFLSALCLALLPKGKVRSAKSERKKNLWKEIKEGLQIVRQNPYMWGVVRCSSIFNLSWNIAFSVYILYAVQDLRISTSVIGVIFASRGISNLFGSLLTKKAVLRFGIGPTIIGSACIASSGGLMAPLAGGSELTIILILILGQLFFGFGVSNWLVSTISLRQAIIPVQLQGRVNATVKFITWGSYPIGSLLGGVLGEVFGLRFALYIGAFGLIIAVITLMFTPFFSLRETSLKELSIHSNESAG